MNEKNPFEVRIHLTEKPGNVLAYANVTVSGVFAVRCIRIMKGDDGAFVSMPRYKSQGKYLDVCFPCTKAARASLNTTVLDAYDLAMKEQEPATLKQLAAQQM
jgi:stage V sporulation protein G